MTSHGRSRRSLFAAAAAIAAAAVTPAAATAAVSVSVTGDDGNPVALGGTLNLRNMNPQLTTSSAPTDNYTLTVTGPNGAKVADRPCSSTPLTSPLSVDYVGNGAYTVVVANYTSTTCATPTGAQSLPFTITASTAITPPATGQLTRAPGSPSTNTIKLPIDLNPGALATDAFVALNVAANPDGSLPGAPTALFPDSTTRTVDVRLDKGPGTYVVASRPKGYTGSLNPQAFGPWAMPAAIRAFDPFDLNTFTWTDTSSTSASPSYRFKATITATSATGSVNIAIGRGKKGKYKSLGTAKIRKHAFAKRFRVSVGTYRIRFKYKGNATVAGGFEIRIFRIARRVSFSGATFRSSAVG